ncbi:hypothetical protein ACIBI7_35960 [Nonomuraea fuscirosea]|uniref:hypothetical protein n=1 Tax=Nonomuraea fuscirosea TaxID=1291556 RepID=UPI0037B8660E
MSEQRLSWSGNDRDGWTGRFWSSPIPWQFRIVPIVGGVAYRLDNPLPNHGYRSDREPYFETSDKAKEYADILLREFEVPAAILVNRNYRHQYADAATEYTFANRLYTHDCDGPCDPRDDGHYYHPESITMRRVGGDTWIITRPGGRHANHSQEWALPDPLPGTEGYPGDAFRFTEDKAFDMVQLLDENRD